MTSNHITTSDNATEAEHLRNFLQLPFFHITSPSSSIPSHFTFLNLQSLFRQVPAATAQTLSHSSVSSNSHSSHSSFSSLPPLIPIPQFPNLNPPPYSSSYKSLPTYHASNQREFILRRIREITIESREIQRRILEERDQTITRIQEDTQAHIENHLIEHSQEIRGLELLLDL